MRRVRSGIYTSIIAILFILVVIFGITIHKKNKSIEEAKLTISQTQAEIKDKSNKIKGLETELEKSKSEKDQLEKENSNLKKEIENLKKKRAEEKAAQAVKNAASQKKSTQTTPKSNTVPSSANKICYLTFDDGPSPRTVEILDILKKYNVKATFFVINSKNMNYLKRIHEEGHAIGLHAYNHNYAAIYKNTTAYFNDLQAIQNKVYSVTGVKSDIMRFPGGSSNVVSKKYCNGIMTALTNQVTKKGFSYFDWNVDSDDAGSSYSSYTKIVNNVLSGANGKNSICVLMHDATAKASTVQALPKIIEGLEARGFKFDALSNQVTGFHHHVNN